MILESSQSCFVYRQHRTTQSSASYVLMNHFQSHYKCFKDNISCLLRWDSLLCQSLIDSRSLNCYTGIVSACQMSCIGLVCFVENFCYIDLFDSDSHISTIIIGVHWFLPAPWMTTHAYFYMLYDLLRSCDCCLQNVLDRVNLANGGCFHRRYVLYSLYFCNRLRSWIYTIKPVTYWGGKQQQSENCNEILFPFSMFVFLFLLIYKYLLYPIVIILIEPFHKFEKISHIFWRNSFSWPWIFSKVMYARADDTANA